MGSLSEFSSASIPIISLFKHREQTNKIQKAFAGRWQQQKPNGSEIVEIGVRVGCNLGWSGKRTEIEPTRKAPRGDLITYL